MTEQIYDIDRKIRRTEAKVREMKRNLCDGRFGERTVPDRLGLAIAKMIDCENSLEALTQERKRLCEERDYDNR
jgi:hypothetical protein